MKNLILLLVAFGVSEALAQSDRYNYVQKQTDTSILIAWRNSTAAIGTLEWGADSSNLVNTVTNASATSKHSFELTGLTPNTKYFYRTSTDAGYISAIDHFFTAKSNGESHFSFLHYGDCGYDNSIQNSIATLMNAEKSDFGIVTGDIDQGIGNNYDAIYFNVYKDILKNYCHFPAIGNHDTYFDNAATYLDDFYLPTNNPQQTERYYSFLWGNAKFISLDSNIPYTVGTDQYNWLIDELKCNNQQWVFIFFHHPPWTNAWSADYFIPFTEYFLYEGNEDMRTDLIPVFEQYNVDFILNGHSHCYQRGEMNGVKYVISGGAGASTLDFNTNSNAPNIDTEIYINQYVRFNVDNDTATYVCIDDAGNVADSVFTSKPNWSPFTIDILEYDNALHASNGFSYQWYQDGNVVNGATDSTYVPTSNGSFQVEVTNQYGCIFYSESYQVSNAGLEELFQNIEIFPNPAKDYVLIQNHSQYSGDLQLTDMYGKEISTMKLKANGTIQLNVNQLSTGIYLIRISSEVGEFTKRIILR
jgi:hypothetical protein